MGELATKKCRLRPSTLKRLKFIGIKKDIKTLDKVIVLLLDKYKLYRQKLNAEREKRFKEIDEEDGEYD